MNRRFFTAMAVWLGAYASMLAVSFWLLEHVRVSGFWLAPVSLLPMIPAAGLVHANMQRYRDLDELEKRILSEAIVFAFACSAVATFSYGFLENTAGAPVISYFWVWPVMATFWIIGSAISHARYR